MFGKKKKSYLEKKTKKSENIIANQSEKQVANISKLAIEMFDDMIPLPDETILKQKGAGRPTVYKPEYCKYIIKEMSKGKSIETVSIELGFLPDRFYSWAKKYPEFKKAMKIAKHLCERWWVEIGRYNLTNNKFNHVLWMMNMNNRFNWTTNKIDKTVTKKFKKTLEVKFDDNRIAKIANLAASNQTIIDVGKVITEEQSVYTDKPN